MHTRSLALIIYMSAVYATLSYLPGFPVIGVENARISLVSGIAPVYGLLLGPWLGFLSCLIGACINRVVSGANLFQWLTLPATPISALIAGTLVKADSRNTWSRHLPILILTTLILAWYLIPIGRAAPYFPILHWIALTLMLSFRNKLPMIYGSIGKARLAIYIAIASFSATMTTHMYGTLMFILAAHLLIVEVWNPALLLTSIIPVVIVERLTFTVVSTIIGVPLALIFKKNMWI
ncbi:MAG: hypothetical protein QW374_06530 [Candidatus Bathyarchaeia archaeon]